MLEKTEKDLEEFQVVVNVDLQKLVSHYLANGYDPFTSFNYIYSISEMYLDKLKEQYGKMVENRGDFEQGFKKDLETLLDEQEDSADENL